MKRFYFFLLACLAAVSSIVAQDIPTGLVRIKNRRTATAYLTANSAGTAIATNKVSSGLTQIWIIDTKGNGYIVRSANTGEYLNSDWASPASGSTTLYIQKSPNANGYYNISSVSDFSGSNCLNKTNSGTGITSWSYSGDSGSDWAIEAATDVDEETVLQNIAAKTGYVSELQEGVYYRLVSYYGRAMTDAEALGDDISTQPIDASDIAQYWTLVKDGSNWRIQNVLTQRFIQRQTATSTPYRSTTQANIDQLNLKVNFAFTALSSKWESLWRIAYPGDSQGLHDANSQNHNVVLWSTSADASVWTIQQVEVSQDAIDAARERLAEYESTIGAFKELEKQKTALQTALNNLFEDKACTTLKADIAALSDDDLAANADFAQLTDEMKAMVLKIKNETWQQFTNTSTGYTAGYEKFFRIADYHVYSHDEEMANASNFTMSNPFGRLSGPTGIVANKGDVIYIYVSANPRTQAELYLEAVGTDGVSGNHPTGALSQLKAGLNLLQFTEQKMLYVLYRIKSGATGTYRQLSRHDDITVHIEGGQLNGYWDATRGMTNADWKLLQQQLLKASPFVNLKTERLVFQMDRDLVVAAEPNEMEGLMHIWNTICANEDRFMGVEDFEGRYNNIWNAFSGASSYMHSTTRGTWYTESTIPTVMNYNKMRTGGGNLWGPSHEIGHNHQGSINVIGTTESSNNLFSNINTFESGILNSRRFYPLYPYGNSGEAKAAPDYIANKVPWLGRNIWSTTGMFFQLYLYFHVQGHDPDFYPNLFRQMRKKPINKWSGSGGSGPTSYGKDDYLHLAKMICDVAQADLSEFFEAHGMFIPVNMYAVSDYSNYTVTTTQAHIDAAKKYMQKYEKKLGNIMFIDDRIIKKKANADNIFGCVVASDGYKRANDEYPYLMASSTSAYVGGDYESYTDDAKPVTDDWYKLSANGKTITFQGEKNYAGHKFYDKDGNLIWATNKRSIALPEVVTKLGLDNVIIMTANYDMSDTLCTDTKPEPDAVNGLQSGDAVGKQEVFDIAGRRVGHVSRGIYIVNGKKVVVK